MYGLEHITLGATSILIQILIYSWANKQNYQKVPQYAKKYTFAMDYLQNTLAVQAGWRKIAHRTKLKVDVVLFFI